MQKLRSILFLAVLALPTSAFATPLLYSLTTTGSGNLGATTFTDATIVFTQVADTNDIGHTIVDNADAYYTVGNPVYLTIVGVGDYTLTSAMFLSVTGVVDPASSAFGIYDNFSGGFYGINGTGFLTYFLATTLPATSGTGLVLDYNRSLITSVGDLHFSTFSGGSGLVVPAPTPEPSSLALLGTGMLGAVALARRRLARS